MNTNLFIGCCLAATFAFGTLTGFGAGRYSLGKQVAEIKAEYAQRESELNSAALKNYTELQERYKDAQKRIDVAIAEKRRAVAMADDLRSRANQLHKQSEAYANKYRELSRTSDTCRSERERVAKCAGLLGEGAELVSEGAGLSSRLNADKNILIEGTK